MDTPFFRILQTKIEKLGGFHNAHLHLCRAGTLSETEKILSRSIEGTLSHLSLSVKHGIIPLIHESAEYNPQRLKERARIFLDQMVTTGTTRADTLVDVTLDRVGTTAFDVFRELKGEYKERLDLQIGSYSPLGFKDTEMERWALIEDTAQTADFIGCLPERDDQRLYPEHIGFEECCARAIALAHSLNKRIHIHVDQKNDPREKDTQRIISVIDRLKIQTKQDEPLIWLVHVISPSAVEEDEFKGLIQVLVDKNIGVLCCPSAALSMRQLRSLKSPTHNSIARVLELLEAGISVRLGSDNINDITSPAGTPNLMDEIFVLCNAIRFYDVDILAKIAAGKPLDGKDRKTIRDHLDKDRIEVQKSIEFYRS